ncbi:MAG: hypothetical protein J7K75_13110 [Desulfuromonas sp.]|nr:hypothetical protein [Desulfuromonas sp.]
MEALQVVTADSAGFFSGFFIKDKFGNGFDANLGGNHGDCLSDGCSDVV